jgi:DNA-binding response OmpR family regulator
MPRDELAKVLVIDDDPLMLRLVERVLVVAGHQVFSAKDGFQGSKMFRAHRPDIVITDILMPEQEGIETIRNLRREEPALAIIAMSGGGAAQNMTFLDYAAELGADATLAKPFRPAELIQAVNKLSN